MIERDNVRDHRAGTSDLPFSKDAQDRLCVHHIVIPPDFKLMKTLLKDYLWQQFPSVLIVEVNTVVVNVISRQ